MGGTTGNVIGRAATTFTPVGDTRRVPVKVCICAREVPPAGQSILGRCEYYYRPLHVDYVDKTGVSTWDAVKAWATRWNPWDDAAVAERLIRKRDKLIEANNTDGDWSRHANFMMRHIGCGHFPPDYYVSYGYYYCSIYGAKLKPKLSKDGKAWLEKARRKLQENIEKGLADNMVDSEIVIPSKRFPNRTAVLSVAARALEVDSVGFKTFAFKTHVPAYLDAGLADLGVSDLLKIGGQPNLEEWLDGETWDQAIQSGKAVAGDWYERTAEKAGELGRKGINTTRASAQRAGDAVQHALDALTRKLR